MDSLPVKAARYLIALQTMLLFHSWGTEALRGEHQGQSQIQNQGSSILTPPSFPPAQIRPGSHQPVPFLVQVKWPAFSFLLAFLLFHPAV